MPFEGSREMTDKSKVVFFNTAYMRDYRGRWRVDVPVNGGLFISQNGWGGEVFNFQPYEGMMYGYVEPGLVERHGPQRKINISRLIGPGATRAVLHVSGILVVWVARPPESHESVMVGWYENATVYRTVQHLEADPLTDIPNGSYDYFAMANESDCQLIPETDRTLTIPRGKGGLGRSNIWYADSPRGRGVKAGVIDFINK